MDKGKVEPVLN